MSRIDDLAADQRAVLQLLLKQGKSYVELGAMLRMDRDSVRARALTALEDLGPRDGAAIAPERRAEVADYLLGQQSASERQATREFLEGSAAGRAWARVVAGELKPVAGDALPDIPAERAEVEQAFDALQARETRRAEVQRSSKLGGAILIIGAVIVAVALILVIRGGGNDDNGGSASNSAATTATTGTGTQTQTAGQPQIEKQINLRPPGGGKSPLGVLYIVRQDNQRLLAVEAQDLPPTTRQRFYAVWLAGGGQQARPLGFTPPVTASGKDKGRLRFANPLPSGAEKYKQFLVTAETQRSPKQPGQTVLSGAWALPSS
jgi:hypothetical protein